MIERILSQLFPPRLPGRVSDWGAREEFFEYELKPACGPARRKKDYENGIERHFAEARQAAR